MVCFKHVLPLKSTDLLDSFPGNRGKKVILAPFPLTLKHVKEEATGVFNMFLPPLRRVAFCWAALYLLVSTGLLLAQNSTGTISGRVIDPTAAAVAGAEVRVINQVDKTSRSFTTESTG